MVLHTETGSEKEGKSKSEIHFLSNTQLSEPEKFWLSQFLEPHPSPVNLYYGNDDQKN